MTRCSSIGRTTTVTTCSFAKSWRRAELATYLEKVERAVLGCRSAYVERYVEEVITPERVNLRIRLRFEQGHLPEINEAAIVDEDTLVLLDYRYHCQDGKNSLIFRYDSTPHFPDLSSFPHHKHLPGEVIDSDRPNLPAVVEEAERVRPHEDVWR